MEQIRWRDLWSQAKSDTQFFTWKSGTVTAVCSTSLALVMLYQFGSSDGLLDEIVVVVSAVVGSLFLSPLIQFLGNLWRAPLTIRNNRIEQLESEVDELTLRVGSGELVTVTTFHHGNTGQVVVTNAGDSDEFAAQVVGWVKGTGEVALSRSAWYLKWAESEGLRRELNSGERGQIDLAWIKLAINESLPVEDQNSVTFYVNNCPVGFGDPKIFAGHRYNKSRSLKPIVYSFLLCISAKKANRSQTVCIVARVVGRIEDDPKRRLVIQQTPKLWLDRCDEPPKPTPSASRTEAPRCLESEA